jgi:hypothetical protein
MPKTSIAAGNKAAPAKPFARLLVADDFRIENTGKLIAIGLYADNVVLFKVPENAPPPSKEVPYGIDALSLVVVIGGTEGEQTVKITLGKNKPVEQVIPLKRGGSANLHLPIKPFNFAEFGVKQLVVEFAGATFKLPFEIRAEYIAPVADIDSYVASITRYFPSAKPKPEVEDAKIVATKERKSGTKPRARRA